MNIRRISFLGVRTSNFDAMTVFVRDVLGLRTSHLDDDWAIFPLESGGRDFFEIYGSGHTDTRLMTTASDGPIAAFAVDDLVAARAELETAGTEILSDVIWAAEAFANPAFDGYGWFFFRAPDGNVYVIQQDGLAMAAGPDEP